MRQKTQSAQNGTILNVYISHSHTEILKIPKQTENKLNENEFYGHIFLPNSFDDKL